MTKSVETNVQQTPPYQSDLSRRDTLKWFGLLAANSALALTTGCNTVAHVVNGGAGHWPTLDLKPIVANGYGKDPNLILPPASPWPRTLNNEQLTLIATLSDFLVPREGDIPSAAEVKVPDVIDEWISAPYADQQNDRHSLLHALVWIDDEALQRFDKRFIALAAHEQTTILDDIAWHHQNIAAPFVRIAKAFDRFKRLVLAAFFCSPEGNRDIGYIGNVPMAGDYPGPSFEANKHLEQVLIELGLSEYAYRD